MRTVSAMLVLIMRCSCSSSVKKPPVITDGFSCTVTAEYEDSQTEFKLKKESETITVEYLSPSDIKGMVVDISPAGKYVSYEGITTVLNDDLLSASLIGAVIDMLNYNFETAEYNSGEYDCGAFKVSLFSDGRISSVNFSQFNCRCYFNY